MAKSSFNSIHFKNEIRIQFDSEEKIEKSIVKHYNCTIYGYPVILIEKNSQFLLGEFFKCILIE